MHSLHYRDFSQYRIVWHRMVSYQTAARYISSTYYNARSFLHNFHNVGCILLGITSILINDDTIFNERVVILWSIGYFGVDILDCALRKDGVYLLHGAFCFLLGLVNYTTPLCRQLRTNSKATLCEISNPIMHLAKKTRNPIHFAAFALVYTLCRIVWIPIIMHQMHQLGMPWTDVRILGVASFYGLNLFWYYKILKILVDGLLAGDEKPKKE